MLRFRRSVKRGFPIETSKHGDGKKERSKKEGEKA